MNNSVPVVCKCTLLACATLSS